MSVSLNSASSSTGTEAMREAVEEVAELTQNHDEALDVMLALGTLGGLRHSAACDAAEQSNKRFDDRNHRLHESRMKDLGMEGEEKEAEDMSHQVLIRSPTIHNHYPSANQPLPPVTANQPAAPTVDPPKSGLSNLATSAIAAGLLAAGLGTGVGATYLMTRPDTPAVVAPADDKDFLLNLMPPDKKKL